MIYRDFKGLRLSMLGFGTMRLPTTADGAIDPVGHGTGAFILKQANGSSGATLERNDTYWGTKAAAPGIDVTLPRQ